MATAHYVSGYITVIMGIILILLALLTSMFFGIKDDELKNTCKNISLTMLFTFIISVITYIFTSPIK